MKLTTVPVSAVYRKEQPDPHLSTANGCPLCGAAVQEFESEWEVSGLPVSGGVFCVAKCGFEQGYDPDCYWVKA